MASSTQFKAAADRYLQTRIQSSRPLELVVVLYDGALQALAAAQEALVKRDIPARRVAMDRALAIVAELQNTLDMEQGREIAAELDRLYTWITERLVDATVKQDPAPVGEVRRVLEVLRDAWRQIAVAPAGQPAP